MRYLKMIAVVAVIGIASFAVPAGAHRAPPGSRTAHVAYTNIGNSRCQLHAYAPTRVIFQPSPILFDSSGAVQCVPWGTSSTKGDLEIQVCMQVQKRINNRPTYATMHWTCRVQGDYATGIAENSEDVALTTRYWYRTWVWGSAKTKYGSSNKTYTSNGVCITNGDGEQNC